MFWLLEKEAESIEICAVSLHSFSVATDWSRLLSVIGAAERDRISRLSRKEDRLRRLASHLLVSTLLGEKLGLKYRKLDFERGRYGKPYLNLTGAPCFNLSHSGSLAVCALAHHPVGIDVERCDPIDEESLRMLLGSREKGVCDEGERQENLRSFYARWTMLESWLKAEGTGLHEQYPLSSFDPEPDEGRFRVQSLKKGMPPWIVEAAEVKLPEQAQYALAVCRRPQEPPASAVGMLDGDNLVERFCMLV